MALDAEDAQAEGDGVGLLVVDLHAVLLRQGAHLLPVPGETKQSKHK